MLKSNKFKTSDNTMNENLALAVNKVQSEMGGIRSQYMNAINNSSPKHQNLYKEMDCKEVLTFKDMFSLYDREGAAYGALNQISDKCFEEPPVVVIGDESQKDKTETPQEKELRMFFKRTKFWRKFKDGDLRRMVGEYSCLLIQVKDNEKWDVPLEQISLDDISGFIPTWQENITVSAWDNDEFSDRYGEPTMYSYTQYDINSQTNNNAKPGKSMSVHHSRVILLGEAYYGRSMLASGYNAFRALEKVTLSGGEGVFKNAASHVNVDFDTDVDISAIAQMYGVPLEELSDAIGDQIRELNKSFDAALITQGGKATVLSVTLPDLRDSFDNPLAVAAASLQIPSTIVIGMQTGERASQQDTMVMNKRCTSRRNNTLTPDIEDTLQHFVNYGAIPTDDYTVVWNSLLESSESEKLTNAKTMSETNRNSPGDPVYTAAEMRVAGGYEADNNELTPIGEDE